MLVNRAAPGSRFVAPELVRPQVQNVEIGIAVVVDVAGGDAHGVSPSVEAAFVGDVREAEFPGVEVVAEQAVAQD